MSDPAEHWLFRLAPADWIAAAQNELLAARAAPDRRRRALTHVRRAGGMALNAVLAHTFTQDDPPERILVWGRSYLDHLRALAEGPRPGEPPVSPAMRHLAQTILQTPLSSSPGNLVQLKPGGATGPTAATLSAVEAAAELVAACAAACKPGPAET